MGIHFCRAVQARALSLATGLVARIQHSHCRGLTLISGWEPKSCFKPLQTEATLDHYYYYFYCYYYYYHLLLTNRYSVRHFILFIYLKKFFLNIFIGVKLLYNGVLVSAL